jgi:hypothetical protein
MENSVEEKCYNTSLSTYFSIVIYGKIGLDTVGK